MLLMNWFLYDRDPCYGRVKFVLAVLRQFVATESPLKMMKNAFDFTLRALFFLKIFTFVSYFMVK